MNTDNYDTKYPSVADLKRRAQKRLPGFAFDYLDGAIDGEHCKKRNRDAWHAVTVVPRYLRDVTDTDTVAEVFGHRYALPVGVAPVGLGGMLWPGAETALATAAERANIPYTLSTFGTTALETIAEVAPTVSWFQLYVPKKISVMKDLITRVKNSGYQVLVVTLDIPVGAKRNRELRRGLKLPFSLTADIVRESLTHPAWSLQTLRHGLPDFVNVARYRDDDGSGGLAQFITEFNMHGVTAERIKTIRELWDGALVLKGIQHARDLTAAVDLGADGVIVSNHGGRQLDAAPASAVSLAAVADDIRARLTLMVDGGLRTGMDIVRAGALGARMTFAGRAFYWGVAALGGGGGAGAGGDGGGGGAGGGANQVTEIFRDEITRTLKQIGCPAFAELGRDWLG